MLKSLRERLMRRYRKVSFARASVDAIITVNRIGRIRVSYIGRIQSRRRLQLAQFRSLILARSSMLRRRRATFSRGALEGRARRLYGFIREFRSSRGKLRIYWASGRIADGTKEGERQNARRYFIATAFDGSPVRTARALCVPAD